MPTLVPDVYRGFFWLPDRPERRIRGTLTFTVGSARLRTEGVLLSTLRRSTVQSDIGEQYELVTSDLWPQDVLVHGALDDHHDSPHQEDVTLLSCVCTAPEVGPVRGLMSGGDHQTWEPIEVLRGERVTDDGARFTSIRVRVHHLEEWADLPGATRKVDPGQRVELVCDSVPTSVVPVFDGAELRLVADLSVDGPSAIEGAIRRMLWVQIDGLKPSTLTELDRLIVAPLLALLTLCTGRECVPAAVQVGPGTTFPWLDFVHSGIDPSGQRPLSTRDMIVKLEDLGLEGVGRWLGVSEKLGPIPHKVAAVIARRGSVIENDFHDLATAAEGLHRRLHPENQRFSNVTVKKVKKAVKDVLKEFDDDVRTAVREAIGNIDQLAYRTRLSELLAMAGDCVPGVAGHDPEEWKLRVVRYRNRFAHELDHGPLDYEGVGHCIALKESLKWLLIARMLLEANVSPERLASRISTHGRYTPFIRQARDLLPEVYGSATIHG
ncbi:HEPN domain-containing protein [Microtetraspora malaysiensis]|uniref:ApeA N-terminal domain 1-containing protein n=1 Tax=Microtetraspora malaysiensis TaxID=161358 RepID=UPI003D92329C